MRRQIPGLRGQLDADVATDLANHDGNRASEVTSRVRALAKKTDIEKVPLDVNDLVREVIALMQRELISHKVSLLMEFAHTLPIILGESRPTAAGDY